MPQTNSSIQQTVLTGIKPTGNAHLGNLLGAIEPAITLSKQYPSYLFIADYHALTTVFDTKFLQEQTYHIAATWLANGALDETTIFYKQSDIPEIFELAWILSCLTAKGVLNRAHSYKAAVDYNINNKKDADYNVNCGHYLYPILMAADILITNATFVPVGQDQKQHLEIARDIANVFNQTYGDTFVLPEPIIQESIQTIPGIDGRKMSKSYRNEIPLYTSSKALRKRIMQIQTDSKGIDEVKDPTTCNLFAIFKYFATPTRVSEIENQYKTGGLAYGSLKQELFELIEAYTANSKAVYESYMQDTQKIDSILTQGKEKMRELTKPLLQQIRNAIGII